MTDAEFIVAHQENVLAVSNLVYRNGFLGELIRRQVATEDAYAPLPPASLPDSNPNVGFTEAEYVQGAKDIWYGGGNMVYRMAFQHQLMTDYNGGVATGAKVPLPPPS